MRWRKADAHLWLSDAGWLIEHCGHPTANNPYLLVTPEGRKVLQPNGRAWRLLSAAKEQAEEMQEVRRLEQVKAKYGLSVVVAPSKSEE